MSERKLIGIHFIIRGGGGDMYSTSPLEYKLMCCDPPPTLTPLALGPHP